MEEGGQVSRHRADWAAPGVIDEQRPWAQVAVPVSSIVNITPEGMSQIVWQLAQQLSVLHCRPVHEGEVKIDAKQQLDLGSGEVHIEYRGQSPDSEVRSIRWHQVVARSVAALHGEDAEQWWTDFGDSPLEERFIKELRAYLEAKDWYAERSLIVTKGFSREDSRWSLPELADL